MTAFLALLQRDLLVARRNARPLLVATLTQPMGAPVQVDEGYVTGPLLFSLDRQGNATVTGQPEVRAEASQMVSGLDLAHGFFPGLPGADSSY